MYYKVSENDSPDRIAQKFTGNPARMTELLHVNTHKPRVAGLGGVPTFQSLAVGEKINIPAGWPQMAVGVNGRPQGLGDQAAVNTIIQGSGSNDALSAASALITALATFSGVQSCVDPAILSACGAFQSAADAAGISQAATGAALGRDCNYGPLTAKVLQATIDGSNAAGVPISSSAAPSALFVFPGGPCNHQTLPAAGLPFPVDCSGGSSGGGGGGSGGGGGGSGGGGGGVTPVNVVTTTTTGSNLPLIVGGIIVAAGLATIAYMSSRKHPAASAAPSMAHRAPRRMSMHHRRRR